MKIKKIIVILLIVQSFGINSVFFAQKKSAPAKNLSSNKTRNVEENFNNKERYALVIGNENYPKNKLDKPISDAKTLSRSLKKVGFQVTEKFDMDLQGMKSAINEFSQKIPKGSVALLFFAGHGVQISGKNFLLPVDYGELKAAEDFLKELVDLDGIISAMSQKSGLNIIILDACRDNPTKLALPVAVEEGLAPVTNKTSAGILIAYSTAPHTTALDDSPYIRSLSYNILMNPGRIEDVFIKTRIDVENETNAGQIPWESVSLKRIFYFSEPKSSAVPETAASAAKKLLTPKLPFGISALQPFSFISPVINANGKRASIVNGTARAFKENYNSAGIEMVEIKGGDFDMGSSAAEVEKAFEDAKKYRGDDSDEEDSEDDEAKSKDYITTEMPKHRVTVSGFFMSKHEITQRQWRSVMGKMPKGFESLPANFRGDDLPVVGVTWEEANEFCSRLTNEETGRFYRLPSEAEWEYAAKAGKDQPFGFGSSINADVANYFAAAPFGHDNRDSNRLILLPVGSLKSANPFGLYDMHGNVAEWTADFWNNDYSGAPDDGSAWEKTNEDNRLFRVIRGGGWDSIGNDCRSAARRKQPFMIASTKIGFRIVVRQD